MFGVRGFTSFRWRNLIPPRPHRDTSFPNSRMVPLSISHTTQVTQTTNIGLKTRLPRARRLRGSFSIILPKVSFLFPFLKSLTLIFFKNICKISNFPRRRDSVQVPQNRRKQCCNIRPLVQLPATTLATYPLPPASSSLTIIQNNSSS